MTDIDIPAEVIELRRRFEAAELACKHISDELPSGVALAEGTAVITDEQRERLDAARAERARIAEQLRGHPWWKTMPSRTNVWEWLTGWGIDPEQVNTVTDVIDAKADAADEAVSHASA